MTRRAYELPSELTYAVLRNMGNYWEYIAAFNSVNIARRYADDCRMGTKRLGLSVLYDVRPIGGEADIERESLDDAHEKGVQAMRDYGADNEE